MFLCLFVAALRRDDAGLPFHFCSELLLQCEDVLAIDAQTARKYWNKLKQRLKEEGNETVTNCHQLKLRAAGGKMRLTDVADTEQLFRIIQSISSPTSETPLQPLYVSARNAFGKNFQRNFMR